MRIAVAGGTGTIGRPLVAALAREGHEVHDLRSLGRMWRQATGPRTLEVPVPLPARLGRALREGWLTCADPDVRGTRTFAAWLAETGH
jgi:nucleoside-diphosphate-sugar epimerase